MWTSQLAPNLSVSGTHTRRHGSEPPARSSWSLSLRSQSPVKQRPPNQSSSQSLYQRFIESWKFKEDYRSRLPLNFSRFLGYRPPSSTPPYMPLPIWPFTLLDRICIQHEVWLFAWIGSFGSILLIEAIMSSSTAFRDVYHSPIIVSSFGASAILIFGVVESPLSQPRNLILGHFVSALIGTAITRLWALNGGYKQHLDNLTFYPPVFVNGGLCMATSLVAQLLLGSIHPPGGATALAAATEADVVRLSWNYLPVIVASTMITLSWALIVNNLGRRRYPLYWWSVQTSFVQNTKNTEQKYLEELEDGKLRHPEDGGRPDEALFLEQMYVQEAMHEHTSIAHAQTHCE